VFSRSTRRCEPEEGSDKGKLAIVLALTAGLLAGSIMSGRAGGADAPLTFDHLRRLLGYQVVLRGIDLGAGESIGATVRCPRGKEVLGGGAQVIPEGSGDFHTVIQTVIQESGPGTIGNKYLWAVEIRNDDTATHASAYSLSART
jgi:hypothetical protein